MKDVRATPLSLCLKIDTPAIKMSGLKPLAAKYYCFGGEAKCKDILTKGVSPVILAPAIKMLGLKPLAAKF